MAPKTHTVRVRVLEVPYVAVEPDILGNDRVVEKTGYGPGHQNLDPYVRLGRDADPNSDEFAEALNDQKLGQKIELLDADYVRLMGARAVVDEETAEALAVETDEQTLNVVTASVEDLAHWIKSERPNVQEVVNASNGEADLAQKLLEAEAMATDNEPRRGVVDGLSAVIARG